MTAMPVPPKTAVWTLKKLGYTQEQINQAWGEYFAGEGEGDTDRGAFLHYVSCRRPAKPATISQLPPPNWQPTRAVVEHLLTLGVPEAIIAQYREEWLLYAVERGESIINWDAAFRAFVIQSLQAEAKLIGIADYQPSRELCQHLHHQGLTVRECSLLIAEFKLYWNETGSVPRQQAEWDRLLLKHQATAHHSGG